METVVPKVKRKLGEAAEDGGDGKRRRKPKPVVEVNSTFTELRQLLQEMRPCTIQVLKTPYHRNCKAARNMRKGVRQIRDLCKQVRLETVTLAKKKPGEDTSRKKQKPEVAPAEPAEGAEEVPKKKTKVNPPLETGTKLPKKKQKAEVAASPPIEGEEAPRKRKKPELAIPPVEETPDYEARGYAEVETPPLDAPADDEIARELDIETPPVEASLDDENDDE